MFYWWKNQAHEVIIILKSELILSGENNEILIYVTKISPRESLARNFKCRHKRQVTFWPLLSGNEYPNREVIAETTVELLCTVSTCLLWNMFA